MGDSAKMSKNTNRQQVQHLLTLMQMHPGIARGFFKGDKQELQRFWQNTETELNALGPPTKSSSDWKKVWTDKKKYVWQKAAQNLQHQKGTGGGPNKSYIFSPTEQAIYDLISMKTSVEGVPVDSFGLDPPKNLEMPESCYKTDVDMLLVPQKQNIECTAQSKDYGTPKFIPKSKDSIAKEPAVDVLLAELAVQRDLVEAVKEAGVDMKEQKQYTKKSIDHWTTYMFCKKRILQQWKI